MIDDCIPQYEIDCHARGDTWRGFMWKDRISEGEYTDFTGCSFKMQIRDKERNNQVVHTFATSDPDDGTSWSEITISGDGTEITIEKTDTDDWPIGYKDYDLQCTWPDGTKETLFGGTWYISADKTRSVE